MPADPYVELLKSAAFSLNLAERAAQLQHNRKREFLARDYRVALAGFIEGLEVAPSAAPPDDAAADPPSKKRRNALPANWADRLRRRLLNRPDRCEALSHAAASLMATTEALLDAARRHSGFLVERARRGHVISLAYNAAQQPPPPPLPVYPLDHQP
jgi:hypothetical protein